MILTVTPAVAAPSSPARGETAPLPSALKFFRGSGAAEGLDIGGVGAGVGDGGKGTDRSGDPHIGVGPAAGEGARSTGGEEPPDDPEESSAAPWRTDDLVPAVEGSWLWPWEEVHLLRLFEAPANRYAAGHRGIDIAAAAGEAVRAPHDGQVVFAGPVAGRDVLVLETLGGERSTLEPVRSELPPGAPVTAGEPVGAVSMGGHCAQACLHIGVRSAPDSYRDPLPLFPALGPIRLVPW